MKKAIRFNILAWCVVLGCGWLLFISELSVQWSIYEQYHYGWAVPFLCVWLLMRRFAAARPRPFHHEFPAVADTRSAGLPRAPFRKLCILLLLAAAVLYAPTRWVIQGNPTWRLALALWGCELLVVTLVTLYWFNGLGSLFRYCFPVTFILLAIPWPSSFENLVVQSLSRLDTSMAVEALGLLGVPVLQYGNLVETAVGPVGIDEACSGVHSLQATLMLSIFLGEFYRLSIRRRVLVVVLGCAISFLCNVVRTTVLAWIVAKKGLEALENWHDPTGVSVLLLAFLALWVLVRWFASCPCRAPEPRDCRGAGISTGRCSGFRMFRAAVISWFRGILQGKAGSLNLTNGAVLGRGVLALTLWFVLVEAGTRGWYGVHEGHQLRPVEWDINCHPEVPAFRQCSIRSEVLSQFQADTSFEARWVSPTGTEGQLFYFRWFPPNSSFRRALIQLARAHEPEVCLPAMGMRLEAKPRIVKLRAADIDFAIEESVFRIDGRPVHIFFGIYDDRTGPGRLASRRDDVASRVAAALAGDRNAGMRLLEIAIYGLETGQDGVEALSLVFPRLISAPRSAVGNTTAPNLKTFPPETQFGGARAAVLF